MTETVTERLFRVWTDPQATLGGVVAVGSRCMCGVNEAETVLNSPHWGAWDVCEPCASEQLAVLHGNASNLIRPDLVKAEALRCIQLDRMLSCGEVSDDPALDCAEHGFTYRTGSAGCPVCVLGDAS